MKFGQAAVKNTGIQVSRMLYTKHSAEKRILIQVTALIDLGYPMLLESPDQIRSMVFFIGVVPYAHQSWGIGCKNGVVPC